MRLLVEASLEQGTDHKLKQDVLARLGTVKGIKILNIFEIPVNPKLSPIFFRSHSRESYLLIDFEPSKNERVAADWLLLFTQALNKCRLPDNAEAYGMSMHHYRIISIYHGSQCIVFTAYAGYRNGARYRYRYDQSLIDLNAEQDFIEIVRLDYAKLEVAFNDSGQYATLDDMKDLDLDRSTILERMQLA